MHASSRSAIRLRTNEKLVVFDHQIVEHAAGLHPRQPQPCDGHAAASGRSTFDAAPVSGTLGLAARARCGQGPPAGDSGAVRSAMRRIVPPALSKVGCPNIIDPSPKP